MSHNILSRLDGVKKTSSNQFQAKCPCHDDKTASLSISIENDKTLLYCHAGCETEHVLQSIGLGVKDLYSEKSQSFSNDSVDKYFYEDVAGIYQYEIHRTSSKQFKQMVCDSSGNWLGTPKSLGIELVPFNLKRVVEAIKQGEVVYNVEGEKDVLTLAKFGIVAFTSPMGASKWKSSYNQYFEGAKIVSLFDNDEVGRKHSKQVVANLLPIAKWLKEVELPKLKEKEDITDWLTKYQFSRDDLFRLVDSTDPLDPSGSHGSSDSKKEIVFRKAKERLEYAMTLPPLKSYCGGILTKGELHVLFADTGVGKTVLAVQMADAISKGNSLFNLENECSPCKVAYIDFELTDQQFGKRYSSHDRTFDFNENLYIDSLEYDESFDIKSSISSMIDALNPEVVFIDNITYLSKFSNADANEAIGVMKYLDQLKKEQDKTIVVIAHVPKLPSHKPIELNDLAGSKQLSNFIDSASSIGVSCKGSKIRYWKQLKSRNGENQFDAFNVIDLKLKDYDMVKFDFVEFSDESSHLVSFDDYKEETVEQIKQMHSKGQSYYEIAQELGMSKSTVRRWANDS